MFTNEMIVERFLEMADPADVRLVDGVEEVVGLAWPTAAESFPRTPVYSL